MDGDPVAALASRLRRMRERSGRSLRELERALFVSDSALSRYLSGEVVPPWPVLVSYCELLGRDPRRLRALWARAREARVATPPRAGGQLPGRSNLPADVAGFTGRAGEIEAILSSGDTAPIAIDGMAGVGKSALAIHLAHRLSPPYRDGQLYVDLHGFTPGREPADPYQVLETMLAALGMPDRRIPSRPESRAAVWRSALSDRRMIVVLDNAADAAQVRPLLPGPSASLVLLTSRRRLVDLDDVRAVSLDVLPDRDARLLLERTVGDSRVGDEPDATTEVLRLCGHLPLAIRIAGGRLRHRPMWTVQDLARLLREPGPLDGLHNDHRGVAATFAVSCGRLTADQRRMFRLLGLLFGPDVDAYLAAALAEVLVERARRLLEGLVDVNLLSQPTAGRYRLHYLLLGFARHTLRAEETDGARQAGRDRILNYYLYTVIHARSRREPRRFDYTPDVGTPPAALPAFDTADQGLDWVDGERLNLVTAVHHARRTGRPAHAVQLSRALTWYFLLRGHTRDWVAVCREALDAARDCPHSRHTEVQLTYDLGTSLVRACEEPRQATDCLLRVREAAREDGDTQMEGRALNALGILHEQAGRWDEALAYYQSAIDLHADKGHLLEIERPLTNSCAVLVATGRHHEAVRIGRETLPMIRRVGDPWCEALLVQILGDANRNLGDHHEASRWYGESLAISRQQALTEVQARALSGRALAHRSLGRDAEALADHEDALALARRLDSDRLEAVVRNDYAETCLALGRTARALDHFRRALSLSERCQASDQQARAAAGIATVHRA